MPDHRHLQVEETHEEETSIPQVGWSWTTPPDWTQYQYISINYSPT